MSIDARNHENSLKQLTDNIRPLDTQAIASVQRRLDSLTKPIGSLGQLEGLAKQLAGIQRTPWPEVKPAAVVVMAGDHGITAEGVTPYPSEVTAQMVRNFLSSGAAVNVLAKMTGTDVYVVDMGVQCDWSTEDARPNFLVHKVRHGTRNMAVEPALTRTEAVTAILNGAQVANSLSAKGIRLFAIGEMGIGNTTAASALLCALAGCHPEHVTGKGTGLDEKGVRHKIDVIQKILALHQPGPEDPLGALAAVGGLEICGMVGLTLAAAALQRPIVIDGFISSAAALVAYHLCPAVKPYLVASHQSNEPGHRVMLQQLGLEPPLHLEMRLGEGTGAVMFLPILQAATSILTEMATFTEAGVSTRA